MIFTFVKRLLVIRETHPDHPSVFAILVLLLTVAVAVITTSSSINFTLIIYSSTISDVKEETSLFSGSGDAAVDATAATTHGYDYDYFGSIT